MPTCAVKASSASAPGTSKTWAIRKRGWLELGFRRSYFLETLERYGWTAERVNCEATNAGETAARVMMFSSAHEPAVAVYPDSDKIGVWPGNPDDHVILRRGDGGVDYWDGER